MLDFTGTRIAAIFAHPDDEAFTVGGVLAAFTDRSATVTLISATRGEQGEIADPSLATQESLGQVREQELRNAAAILGISDVRFLDYRDSGMFGTDTNRDSVAFVRHPIAEVAQKLIEVLKEIRPDAVLTFSAEGGYLHPDHIHIHEAVVEAARLTPELVPHLYFASFPREFFQKLVNQEHGTFAGMSEERRGQMGQPLAAFTLIVNIEPYIERKKAAFAAHKTQQPKEGDNPFVESEEARRAFEHNEYYIHAPTVSTTPDPLIRLAADLPVATVKIPTAPDR